MENTSNISSEEELWGLREEGKISEDEYEELLVTLRKTGRADVARGLREKPGPVRTCGLAIASLVLSLLGPVCCVPAVICGHVALRKMARAPALGGRGMALAGLIIGYAGLGLFLVVFSPFFLYWAARAESRQQGTATVMAQLERVRAIEQRMAAAQLRHFPLDSTEGLITQSAGKLDEQISSDGNGSLRIEATEPTTVRLFETGQIDVENARLIYQARVRTENVKGQVYLEMWCHFPAKGEYFSKGLMSPLSGTTNWTTVEIPFLLKAGENPDNVKLNLVIEGAGTVWIDDIRLLKGPLE